MTQTTSRFLADYTPTFYTIHSVQLTVELNDTSTEVINEMLVSRQGEHNEPLVLDGEQQTLLSVSINNKVLSTEQYTISENNLTLLTGEDKFTLTIVTQINPADNTSLEGLFKSGNAFCTQCEAEGVSPYQLLS